MRDKRAKFVQLANQRVNRAIDQIRLVGNLANRNAYEYTEDDSRKIIKALQQSLDKAKARFSDETQSSDHQFSL